MEGAELMEHPIHTLADGAASPALTSRLDAGIAAWAQLVDAVREAALHAQVVAAGEAVTNALTGGHKILVAGNGGSAAIASHVAAEFLGKCVHDRAPLPAINLAESLSSVTAIGNDYGYEQVFVRGVRGLGRAGDVYVAMSTSGRSPNIVASLAAARELGITTIAMTGAGGEHLRDDV
ncbi:MAG TPA: phosphoheptose isomerase, partial [Dermacoccus sp.]|nr:phosphoheptose isomerase [Dermacoccus sp.]